MDLLVASFIIRIIHKMAAPDCIYQFEHLGMKQDDFNVFDLDPISQGHPKSIQFLVLVSCTSMPSLKNVGQTVHPQSSTQILRTDSLTHWLTHSLTHWLPFTGYKPTSRVSCSNHSAAISHWWKQGCSFLILVTVEYINESYFRL